MSENNGFILKAEMYNQEEWYQMYLSMLKVCKKLQQENKLSKEVIDKTIEWVYMVQQNKDNKHLEPIICTDELDELLDILKEVE